MGDGCAHGEHVPLLHLNIRRAGLHLHRVFVVFLGVLGHQWTISGIGWTEGVLPRHAIIFRP